MASDFQHLLNAQDRTKPVPDTHEVLLLDSFTIERRTETPMSDLREEWNKVENLAIISWIEDQGWEYEIFLKNEYRPDLEVFDVMMMLMLPKEAATVYLLRWS